MFHTVQHEVQWCRTDAVELDQDYAFQTSGAECTIFEVPNGSGAASSGGADHDGKVPPAAVAAAMFSNRIHREAGGVSPSFELKMLSGQEGNLRDLHDIMCRKVSVACVKSSNGVHPFHSLGYHAAD